MGNLFAWPWKNDEELLEVRELFYPSPELDEATRREKQQLAVNIVNAWKLRRCRIPHSILATADLVDAILHHDARKNSASAIKAVYASALAKMVTSICDLEQDAAEKRSMMEQAKKLGMPEDWVHLRHAITHGQTPGLMALQSAVLEAVPWMWEHFWQHLSPESEVPEQEVRSRLVEILTGYRRQRRSEFTNQSELRPYDTLTAQACKHIRRICKAAKDADILVDVLLGENILLPSEKQTNLKFKAFLIVWDALLLGLAERIPALHQRVVLGLVEYLTVQTTYDYAKVTIRLEIASKWLQHMLLNQDWTSRLSAAALESLRNDVIEGCLLYKSEYTDAVVRTLLDAMSGPLAESFRQLLDIYDKGGEDGQMDVDILQDAGEGQGDNYCQPTGWSRPVAVWLPKPIGA
ncbi:uncharacterized protein PV09_05013 [Verruconis gallopava]|uniref:Pre-rRNA-processing protein las1 n=1 Tax=Verruconis gallopava TaxID=253628 RepID=A0A0D2AAA6_9PEZI|nr:uncharacterized protein PV09_05013 [Verruconis gallopava]KIW03698.1 hypothetical protein PV09_05013 [Verruconis gallopava]